MTTKTHLVTVSASLAIGALFANAANANTITLLGDYTNNPGWYDAEAVRGTVGCTLTCEGLLSTLTTGPSASVVPDVTMTEGLFSTEFADLC